RPIWIPLASKKMPSRNRERGNRRFDPSHDAGTIPADYPNDHFVAASHLLHRAEVVVQGPDRPGPHLAVDLGYYVVGLETGVAAYTAGLDFHDKHALGARQSDLPGSIGAKRLDRQAQWWF